MQGHLIRARKAAKRFIVAITNDDIERAALELEEIKKHMEQVQLVEPIKEVE